MKEIDLYKKAIQKWGKEPQIKMAIKECGELITALAKKDRNSNGSTVDDIIGEMVDVELLLQQLKVIFKNNGRFGCFTYAITRRAKFKKLENLLK